MGANLNTEVFKDCTKEQLKKDFRDVQDDNCSQYGTDGYAGHIGLSPGLTIHDNIAATESEAYDYLENRVQKWENALAMRFYDTEGYKPTASETKAIEDLKALNNEVYNWSSTLVKRVKDGKSAQKACDKCKSKITVSYIRSCHCPVCQHDFISTATDAKKLEALKSKQKTLETKVADAKKKYALKQKKTKWLVMAMNPS